jgi:hypothetical protein
MNTMIQASNRMKQARYHSASKNGEPVARKRLGWEIYRGFALDAWKDKPSQWSRTRGVVVCVCIYENGGGPGRTVRTVEAATLEMAAVEARAVVDTIVEAS